jgi:hypothetical protein
LPRDSISLTRKRSAYRRLRSPYLTRHPAIGAPASCDVGFHSGVRRSTHLARDRVACTSSVGASSAPALQSSPLQSPPSAWFGRLARRWTSTAEPVAAPRDRWVYPSRLTGGSRWQPPLRSRTVLAMADDAGASRNPPNRAACSGGAGRDSPNSAADRSASAGRFQTEALPVVASPRQAAVRHPSPATSYPLYRPIMTELVADPTRTSTSCCTSTAKKASTSSALVQP